MLIVLSPAKTLDYETPPQTTHSTEPRHLADSEKLVAQLRRKRPAKLASLMSISDKLAELNAGRFSAWSPPFSPDNAKQAVLAFAGDVYDGLDAKSLSAGQLDWAQQRVRILSGLYGVLRPLDLMQAYRLEMGTRLKNRRGNDLYAFWGRRIAQDLNQAMADLGQSVLVNLASDEYFRSIDRRTLTAGIVQPVFEEARPAGPKPWAVISFMAKRARGAMTRYAIEHRVTDAQDLKGFDVDGYAYCEAASTDTRWVFRRG
ncbi:MAG: peroxide stress protein YaaA [Burkholderiaceae bacterium]